MTLILVWTVVQFNDVMYCWTFMHYVYYGSIVYEQIYDVFVLQYFRFKLVDWSLLKLSFSDNNVSNKFLKLLINMMNCFALRIEKQIFN